MTHSEACEYRPALHEAFDSDIRPFLDVVDSIRNIKGLQTLVNFPEIVVLGDQSSGKSSLLEAISGTELPKKSGMATRCPLVIQMRRCTTEYRAVIQYRSFQKGNETVKFDILNPSEICGHIIKAQDDITNKKNQISSEEITLQIFSPNSPDLTLVDLPGLIRSVTGDQPADTPKQIKRLVNKYITKENTIILCVVSGELDIQLNESLDLALKVDPKGERTLGVITKPDMIRIDDRENKIRLLKNEVKPLKKGYTMVCCRSSIDIQNRMTLSEALTKEQKLFGTNDLFEGVSASLLGTANLTIKLTKLLKNSLKNELPNLKKSLEESRLKIEKQLKNIPELPPEQQEMRKLYFIKIRDRLTDKYKECLLQGHISDNDSNLFNEWRGFYKETQDTIENMTKELMKQYTVKKIEEYMRDQRGEELPNMDSFTILKRLLTRHFDKYLPEVEDCALKVKSSIEKYINLITNEELRDFPQFQAELKSVVGEVLMEQDDSLKKLINIYFGTENLIFVADEESINHPPAPLLRSCQSWTELVIALFGALIILSLLGIIHQFLYGNTFQQVMIMAFLLLMSSLIAPIMSKFNLPHYAAELLFALKRNWRELGNNEERNATNAERMHGILKRYLQVADRRICDNMPTFIRLYLNNETYEQLRRKVTELMNSEQFNELMKMDEEEMTRRKELYQNLANVKEALLYFKKI